MTVQSKLHRTSAATPATQDGFSLISNDKLQQIYAAMLKSRMLQESIRVLIQQGTFNGTSRAALGREAAVAGAAIDLLPEDTVTPSHEDVLPSFIQGVPLEKIFSRLSARTAPVRLNRATRAALANKTKKNNQIALVFSSNGTVSQDSWLEALQAAGAQALPMVFVYHHHVSAAPESLEPPTEIKGISSKGKGRFFPRIPVDGNDAVAVYRVASESISRARQGRGPSLIACLHAHEEDPVLNMEKYLVHKRLFSERLKAEVAAGFRNELDFALRTGW